MFRLYKKNEQPKLPRLFQSITRTIQIYPSYLTDLQLSIKFFHKISFFPYYIIFLYKALPFVQQQNFLGQDDKNANPISDDKDISITNGNEENVILKKNKKNYDFPHFTRKPSSI